MSVKRMTAKYPGTCRNCSGKIIPGQSVMWARSTGAYHVNCTTANLTASMCAACSGSGATWKNDTCRACNGSGQRAQEIADPTDLAYEDACARACGL